MSAQVKKQQSQAPVPGDEDETFVLEEVELSDDDHDVGYEEVPTYGSDEEQEEEDFASVLAQVKLNGKGGKEQDKSAQGPDAKLSSATGSPARQQQKTAPATATPASPPTTFSSSTPSPTQYIDEFILSFLHSTGMSSTATTFQQEWRSKGMKRTEYVMQTPQIQQQLQYKIQQLESSLAEASQVASAARSSWTKFRQERDFHRMHHRRVVQEKNTLVTDIKRLRKHYASYEPALGAMKAKYETAMKEKMLMRLERDRLKSRVDSLEQQLRTWEQTTSETKEDMNHTTSSIISSVSHTSSTHGTTHKEKGHAKKEEEKEKTRNRRKPGDSNMPPAQRENPYANNDLEPCPVNQFSLRKTFKGHQLAISALCLHPRKPLVATVSDDFSWKLWSLPRGELIMSGDGHHDWLSSVDFHPRGHMIATGSGDATVKLWDFNKQGCSTTFTEHTQAVWDVSFHDLGDFLISGSMDHTARLWDLGSGRCRQTFRGHVDSVNAVMFQPYGNTLVTGSGDKTVSLWDMRTALCVQTFYGHGNAILDATFNMKADTIVTSDADGIVKLWDIRMVSERLEINTGTPTERHPINEVTFDRSGAIVACASDKGTVNVYSTMDGSLISLLEGHEDSVQSVAFDPSGQFLVSGGSDATFRVWSV